MKTASITKAFFLTGALTVLAAVAFGIVGWVLNIRKLIDMGGMEAGPVTWEGVVRVVGIFLAPLGSVLGFL